MKNTMQPMNQNKVDTFHKINDTSQATFRFLKIVLKTILTTAYVTAASMAFFYGTQSPDVVKCVFFGHEFSLYYSFQGFFDGIASTLHSLLPVFPSAGTFYERCIRALPGILLVIYTIFSGYQYKKHSIQYEAISNKDRESVNTLANVLCVVTALYACALACDRGRTGPFFEHMLERRK